MSSVSHKHSEDKNQLCTAPCIRRESTLRTVLLSRMKFDRMGVEIFVKKLNLIFLIKKWTPIFSKWTSVSCTKSCQYEKEWPDLSLAKSRLLFIDSLPSRQCSLFTSGRDNNSQYFHLESSVHSKRSTDHPNLAVPVFFPSLYLSLRSIFLFPLFFLIIVLTFRQNHSGSFFSVAGINDNASLLTGLGAIL